MTFDPIGLLHEAVAIDSVSGDEAELAGHLVERVGPHVDEARLDEVGNVVVRSGSGPCRVLFLGHTDTVPGQVPVRVEDGNLYGRGSVDAKGALCTALAVAATLPTAARKRVRFEVVGAVEEELPSSKGARHLLVTTPPPRFLIVGEPSGWDAVALGYKGRLLARLRAEQSGRHGAVETPTVAAEVVAAWNRVSGWVEETNAGDPALFDRLQVSLQEIASGADGLRSWARATIGFRLPPRLTPEAVATRLEALFASTPVALETYGHEVAFRGPRDTELARAFRVAIRQAGGRPRTKVKTGTSDLNVVAARWSLPMLAYGPGDASLDHTPDEHLSLNEYRRAIDVLGRVVNRLGERQPRL